MITTERLILRPLEAGDASKQYLKWFDNPGADHIAASKNMQRINDLRKYILARADRIDVLFLGLFERESKRHIGNLKYEPIILPKGDAVLGIFIGEEDARGKGFAGEAIHAANAWLKEKRMVASVSLGVEVSNTSAVRAYEKIGFVKRDSILIPNSPSVVSMVLEL